MKRLAGRLGRPQSNRVNDSYRYLPKNVGEIVVRPFAFEFPEDLDPLWVPANPVRSHFFNGVSLTMPYLEPYLVQTSREAAELIDEPLLLEDMKAFDGQESRHYECHRRLNKLLRDNGYSEFAQVEQRLKASYARLSKRSLRTRLAYSAGFETMTNGFTTWIIGKRRSLWRGAERHVTSFWLMHMLEEAEHKTVAFDAYMAYSGKYLPRAFGVLHGSLHVLGYGLIGMFTALKKDGRLRRPGDLARLVREMCALAWNVAPFLLHGLSPWHNPRDFKDTDWMLEWIAAYKKLPEGELIPLVDTSDPEMPVPF
ncbi:MAG TPA: metal-dependent hydrolase [Deltaproteobacteria bacterium]|nr:metal-dependent hydrolase [Candidatus Binatota bacterium]HIL12772.1 metal-dependent hydrolase [Deltaproteobacteria bacterium]